MVITGERQRFTCSNQHFSFLKVYPFETAVFGKSLIQQIEIFMTEFLKTCPQLQALYDYRYKLRYISVTSELHFSSIFPI